jgi:catechol 2,3-dioxygenase-like lactoylglutathione lyase family enzyme
MIDHVSVPVRDLQRSMVFYDTVLAVLGYRRLDTRTATAGYGKTYSEFWINLRTDAAACGGSHVALRARSAEVVDAFHAAALAAGGESAGPPGLRPAHGERYYAAFVRDPDGNVIEAVTFLDAQS